MSYTIFKIALTALISFGLFQLLTNTFKVPSRREIKTIMAVGKKKKEKPSFLDVAFFKGSHKIEKHLTLNPYKKQKMKAILESLGINKTPEVIYATALMKAGLCLLCAVVIGFLIPLVSIAFVVLAILIYFKELDAPTSLIMGRREEINRELPRFVGTIEQELKSRRDILGILTDYRKNAGTAFGEELDITVADMKTSNYENALTRMETRIGTSGMSDIMRGLIAVLRGDDVKQYFETLNREMRKLEINQLTLEMLKRPQKSKKYTVMLLIGFISSFFVIIGYQIFTTLPKIF